MAAAGLSAGVGRGRRRLLAVAIVLLAWMGAACAAPRIERVTFASYDLDRNGMPLELAGLLLRPAETAVARRPAVIALHGCAGMYSVAPARRNELTLRHRAMADLLVAEGYAVFFPDSFRSRGREEICSQRVGQQSVTQRNRLLDTLGALAWLQQRGDVDPERIAVLGWSHGGSAVLAADNAQDALVEQFRIASSAYFRTAIALYPGCVESVRTRTGYAPAAPLLLLVAGSDDWTAPKPCIALADRLRKANAPADIVVYPDTWHGFDGPDSQGKLHLDHPNGVNPGKGVTIAVNPVAREDAYRRVRQALRAAFEGR